MARRARKVPNSRSPAPPSDVIGSFSIGLILGLVLAAADRANHAVATLAPPRKPAERPGGHPANLSLSQWRDLVVRSFKEFSSDRIPAAAAGVTFFTLLSLFPAISAFVSLYGLFADVGEARAQIAQLRGVLPGGALTVLTDELDRLTASGQGALGFAFILSLLVSIWSANGGVKALLESLNVAYERQETRGFIKLTLVSLAFTLGAVLFVTVGVAATIVAPVVLGIMGLADSGLSALRWPVLFAAVIFALALLYRYGPAGRSQRWRWVTPGGFVGALGWIAMSALFSWYVSNFGHYNKTYGSLGAVVGFLTWIWLSLMVVLYGAELNSELEKEATAGRAG